MKLFRVVFKTKDGKKLVAKTADGKVEYGPGMLARVKRSLQKRRLRFVVKSRSVTTPGDRIAKKAASFVGITESPAGSNDGPMIRRFLAFVGWRKPAAWCAAFACFTLKAAEYPLPYKSAWVPGLEIWARAHKRWIPVGQMPKRGWLVVFEFTGDSVPDHVGIVADVLGEYLHTIEGNTSRDDGGSQANGGGVFVRTRNTKAMIAGRSMVKGYIRTW